MTPNIDIRSSGQRYAVMYQNSNYTNVKMHSISNYTLLRIIIGWTCSRGQKYIRNDIDLSDLGEMNKSIL